MFNEIALFNHKKSKITKLILHHEMRAINVVSKKNYFTRSLELDYKDSKLSYVTFHFNLAVILAFRQFTMDKLMRNIIEYFNMSNTSVTTELIGIKKGSLLNYSIKEVGKSYSVIKCVDYE